MTDLDQDLLRLRMIAEAKQRGISWAEIGRTLKMDGKAAKKYTHTLARSTNARLVARDVAAMSGEPAA